MSHIGLISTSISRRYSQYLILLSISGILLTTLESIEPYFSILLIFYLVAWLIFIIKIYQYLIKYYKGYKKANYELLQSQLVPHFLFNTLNLIYGHIDKNPTKSKELLLSLSELLRYGIYEAKKSRHTIQNEVKFITHYINIYEHRFAKMKKPKIDYTIEDNKVEITPLILFPLIENAFKHGVEKDPENTEIRIKLESTKTSISLTVSNNFQLNESSNAQGFGLQNLKERLEFIYQNNFSLEYTSIDSTFTANLTIQLK